MLPEPRNNFSITFLYVPDTFLCVLQRPLGREIHLCWKWHLKIEGSPWRNAWLLQRSDQFSRAARFQHLPRAMRSYTFCTRSVQAPQCFCEVWIRSYTFLYVLCSPSVILWNCYTFPYVLHTFGMRSSMFLLSFTEKLYVPIRSVQPFRDSVKLLYVPLGSVYVRYTFLNVFIQIWWNLIRSFRFCATVSQKRKIDLKVDMLRPFP